MQRQLRIIRYMLTARIRAAGWAPWILLGGWLLFAVAQEPRMLRRFGFHLIDDAAWVGGSLLAAVLLLSQRRVPAVAAAWTNLVTVAAVALAVMLACRILDQGPWSAGLSDRLLGAAAFFAAWSPAAVCLARSPGTSTAERIAAGLVLFAGLIAGSMTAVALREGGDATAWLAAVLALVAATLWQATPRIP